MRRNRLPSADMRDSWFEFVQPTNRATGYYLLTCGCCGKQNRAAMTLSEGQLFAFFIDRGWKLARKGDAKRENRCPECFTADKQREEQIKAARILPVVQFDLRNCTVFLCQITTSLKAVAPWTIATVRLRTPQTAHSRYVDHLCRLAREDRIKEIKRTIVDADLLEVFVRHLSLDHAWHTADTNEQEEFKAWLLEQGVIRTAPPMSPPKNASSVMPTFVDASEIDDTEEPADWWKSITQDAGA